MISRKNFSGTKLKCVIAIGLGLIMTVFAIIIFSTVVRASGYNPNSGWAIDCSDINTDMRAFSNQAYNADYDGSFWTFHNTRDGDGYKPHKGDIIVYGCYPYGVDYYGGCEVATAHVEICVEDYNDETGDFGVIGGNMGYSATTPYYLGSSVAFTYRSWNEYYHAAYGDRFIYNIWEVTNADVSDNIVYSTYSELYCFNDDPNTYRQMIFAMQGERNWCDIFVSRTLGNVVEAPPKYGCLTLVKVSSEGDSIINNPMYSLESAVYGVFSDYDCTDSVGTLTTDAYGTTDVITLQEGTYYVKELTSSKGHELDDSVYTAEVLPDETTVVKSVEPAIYTFGEIVIQKRCAEGYESNKSLEGAEFRISYYGTTDGDIKENPLNSWTIKTEYNSQKDQYVAQCNCGFLLGTYVIEETKAPEGYMLKDNVMYSNKPGAQKYYDGKYIYVYKGENNGKDIFFNISIVVENIPEKIPEEKTTTEETTTEETTTPETTKEETTTDETKVTETTVTETTKPETTEEITTEPQTDFLTTTLEATTNPIIVTDSDSPKTGDRFNVKKYVAAIAIALGIIGTCALIMRKKRRKN